ncbi:MAG: mechanosensitive ion channel, partial [Candidatus Obscuribacterales bacterium]|nr:mechanosensitive ion channel [Candidatus Obscuribacterales bacterium]
MGKSSVSAATLLFITAGCVIVVYIAGLIRKHVFDPFLLKYEMNDVLSKRLVTVLHGLLIVGGFIQVLDWSSLEVTGAEIVSHINSVLSFSIFKLGTTSVTLWTAIYIVFFTALLLIGTSKLQLWFLKSTENKLSLDEGIAHGVSSIIRIVCLLIGFIVIVQSAGIDLSSLTIMAGALGLGLSLGLQNLTANIVSGLNLYVERPIKVGDRIEVDGLQGDVKKISLRATTIRTNDNIDIIVPNTSFLTGNVTNLSHSSKDIRINIP